MRSRLVGHVKEVGEIFHKHTQQMATIMVTTLDPHWIQTFPITFKQDKAEVRSTLHVGDLVECIFDIVEGGSHFVRLQGWGIMVITSAADRRLADKHRGEEKEEIDYE